MAGFLGAVVLGRDGSGGRTDWSGSGAPQGGVWAEQPPGGGLKAEHYEIESYKGLLEKAELMGHTEAAGLLRRNLEQEERFAEQLARLDRALGEQAATKPALVGHSTTNR